MKTRTCHYCTGPISPLKRADAKFCKEACRVADRRYREAQAKGWEAGIHTRLVKLDDQEAANAKKQEAKLLKKAEDHEAILAELLAEEPGPYTRYLVREHASRAKWARDDAALWAERAKHPRGTLKPGRPKPGQRRRT